MLDRDFANRFLCFYLFGYEDYVPDLDTYMSKAMASINDKTDIELDQITSAFDESMKLNKEIFGKEAFRKVYRDFDRLPPINKAIFDTLSVQFALLSEHERNILRMKSTEMKSEFKSLLYNDDRFFTSVTSSTGDKNRVMYRHDAVKQLIKRIIQS
jgi:hypothetical protein